MKRISPKYEWQILGMVAILQHGSEEAKKEVIEELREMAIKLDSLALDKLAKL